MSVINFLGGLRRELHHIKIAGEEGGYEPALVILADRCQRKEVNGEPIKQGRSFIIPLNCMFKYDDPYRYKNDEKAADIDNLDFWAIINTNKRIVSGQSPSGIICFKPSQKDINEAIENLAICQCAYGFHKGSGVSLCVSYNLFKCLHMFDISPSPQAAAQLLLWIQDRLDDLKNMPDNPEKENMLCGGEATLVIDGQKVATKDMMLTETEAVLEEAGIN